MANPKSDGRMIRKDISNSDKFSALNPEAGVLFCMLIPHFNPYGKMNGHPGFIKGEVCPKITYLTPENIPILLAEINQKTNVKWFEFEGRYWIHSINFLSEHQNINTSKLGPDLLPNYSLPTPEPVPDYSGTTPGLLPNQSESSPPSNVNVNVNVKEREPAREEIFKFGPHPEPKPDLCALAEHSWQKFKKLMPLRDGKFLDEDACREKWARNPAKWNQWLAAVPYYRESREVADGAVCAPMTFLSRKWRDWLQPGQPLGHDQPITTAPDYLWKIEQEQWEREQKEYAAKVATGEITPVPREKPIWFTTQTIQPQKKT